MSAMAESENPVRGRPAKRMAPPHRPNGKQRLAAWVVHALDGLLTKTLRWRWQDNSGGLFEGSPATPVIYCIWHNRLALCMALFRQYPRRRQPERRLAALISASRDGAFLTAVLEQFGVQAARGSSSRRGWQALLELTTWAERGYDLAITPDGPRGPCYTVHPGIIALAQFTGLPIVPVTYRTAWKVCLKSWDRFHVPLPFARCEGIFGSPIHVPREASDEEREAIRAELERRMKECSVGR
jgi:lysophospholipid acyltransferase (LPLAT)-like uncharacterized protein